MRRLFRLVVGAILCMPFASHVFADMPHGGSYDSIKSGNVTRVIEGLVVEIAKKPFKIETSGKDEIGEEIRHWEEVNVAEDQLIRPASREALGELHWFNEALVRIVKQKSAKGMPPLPSEFIVSWTIYPKRQADVPGGFTLKAGELYTFCLSEPVDDASYPTHVYPAGGLLPKFPISLFDSGAAPGLIETLTWNENGALEVTDKTPREGFAFDYLKTHGQVWEPSVNLKQSAMNPDPAEVVPKSIQSTNGEDRPTMNGGVPRMKLDIKMIGSLVAVLIMMVLGLLWFLLKRWK